MQHNESTLTTYSQDKKFGTNKEFGVVSKFTSVYKNISIIN